MRVECVHAGSAPSCTTVSPWTGALACLRGLDQAAGPERSDTCPHDQQLQKKGAPHGVKTKQRSECVFVYVRGVLWSCSLTRGEG